MGRKPELAGVADLLDDVDDGPSVLLLAGVAGIGKTTVWQSGVDHARERRFTLLMCRPAAAEVRLSYAGLFDLLAGVGTGTFDQLPGPQRRALDAALLRSCEDGLDDAPDPRAVAAGFLSVLDGLASRGRVLMAIDDVQWLDEPTRQVVEFAVRRCSGPIATLAACRVGERAGPPIELSPRDPGRRSTVTLGPLTLAELHHVLSRHTERPLSRPALVRIAERTAGNPFYALELARSLEAGADLATLPDSLRNVVRDRLDRLDDLVLRPLLVSSALASPSVDLVNRAMAEGDARPLLEVAEDAGVVALSTSGEVRFTHPLLATGVYAEARPSARRALHRRLSTVVDDTEERARHLALAAVGPDQEAVAALDAAADVARRRGAPASAAELLELAIGLGADDPPRRVRAAQDHSLAADPARARHLLETAISDLDAGPSRAEALALLGAIRFDLDADPEASGVLEQALAEAPSESRLRCSAALQLTYVYFNSGRLDDSLPCAMSAVEAAEQFGEDGLLAEALAVAVIVQFLLGRAADEATLTRALTLEDPARRTRMYVWPTLLAGLVHRWTHRLDECRAELAAVRQRCLDQGAESDLWFVLMHAVYPACSAGDLETARQYVDELVVQAELVGTDLARASARTAQTELWAWAGQVDDARTAGNEALALFAGGGSPTWPLFVIGALGMAELSAGNHEAAADRLAPAADAMNSLGFGEPAAHPFLADLVDALVTLHRAEEAEPVVELLEASGRRPGRTWARAVGARCRGLVLAAQGRPGDALAAFERAMTDHDALPRIRYERARTLLTLGQHQRRHNQRRAARAALDEAARLFDEVGAAQWARNARDELDRLGLRPSSSDELTPSERRVAELAGSGMTVREVAAALLVSPKTVEAHLGRIYRKLGIHSRAELGQHMAGR